MPATQWSPNLEWHPHLDNPTLPGWSVVAVYAVAAVLCAGAALANRANQRRAPDACLLWWLLATGLLFLGINKQLNLQTLLIVLGRRAALTGGWYENRRQAQALFTIAFALTGLAVLTLVLWRSRQFLARNRLVLAGMLILFVFVVLRAGSINHVLQRLGMTGDDARWTWILEIAGSACLAAAASKNILALPAARAL